MPSVSRQLNLSDEHGVNPAQVDWIRIVWALFALQVAATLCHQFADARSGDYANLPLWESWPLLPAGLHRTLLASTFLFATMLFLGVGAAWGAWGMSLTLCYVVVSDYFAFRHVWVLLANIYFWLGWLCLDGQRPFARTAKQAAILALRGYICIVYWLAAAAKLHVGFLEGDVIRRLVQESPWPWSRALDGIPGVYPTMAISSLVLEVLIPIGLLVPKCRRLTIFVGLVFHSLIPGIAWVGHSLNFYLVCSYLFFVTGSSPSDYGHQQLQRWDRLNNWQGDATPAGQQRAASSWWLMTHTFYGNPFTYWYAGLWLVLVAIKTLESGWYLPSLCGVILVYWRELQTATGSHDRKPNVGAPPASE